MGDESDYEFDFGDYLGSNDYEYDFGLPSDYFQDTPTYDFSSLDNFNYDEADLWSGVTDYVTEIPNTATVGQPGYGWKYYSDGTATSPDGQYYKEGKLLYDPVGKKGNLVTRLGDKAVDYLSKTFTKPNGDVDYRKVLAAGAGLYGAVKAGTGGLNSLINGTPEKTGYQGKIPTYEAIRQYVPTSHTSAGPGTPGQRYFTNTYYASPDKVAEAKTRTDTEAAGLARLNKDIQDANAMPTTAYATGGIAKLNTGKYLRGATDGMADKLPATIDKHQPAALSHGEFVIPADVVSHLGNGNSDAGAQRLYTMMDRVRKARTGSTKQGRKINPDKYLA